MRPSPKLLKEWYDKLADSGFEDIEQHEYSTMGNFTEPLGKLKIHPDVWQAKADYYTMADCFLNENTFDNELDKVIWTYHVEGISIRNISKTLFEIGLAKTNNKSTVGAIVKRLETKMKLIYLPSKPNAKRS
jgi:SUMO ligase MMS21 Smc5/6 complex component